MVAELLELPILKGTQSAYDAIAVKKADTIYITTDTKRIHLGDIWLNEGGSVTGGAVEDVLFDEEIATFTIKYADSTTKEIDLALESVMQDVDYDKTTHKLTFTLVSGASTEIDLSDLVDMLPDIVDEVTDETPNDSLPNVGAVKKMLTIGEF